MSLRIQPVSLGTGDELLLEGKRTTFIILEELGVENEEINFYFSFRI
jgi:hypothetical protein